jgi:hypothetical protein
MVAIDFIIPTPMTCCLSASKVPYLPLAKSRIVQDHRVSLD